MGSEMCIRDSPQTCPVDHSEIGKARIRISVLPQRQKAHSACCEATPSCGIKVHSLPQRATRCSRAAGSWHHPIHVECTRCSATGAALMRVVLACLRCAPKARHRQGHKPDPQRDCGPARVASSMACDHGERTCSQPDADLAHGTDKAAIAQPPVAARRHTEHWIRPTASNLVKFGPADSPW